MYSDPDEATDIYTRQCALNVTARDLAVMGATLAYLFFRMPAESEAEDQRAERHAA